MADVQEVVKAVAGPKLIKEPKNNIRIVQSTNPLKLAVARVGAEWLSAPDRYWSFHGSVDKNSERLCNYIAEMFPEFDWQTLSSQKPFDFFSYGARVITEIKSVKGNKGTLTSNASVYPEKVRLGDAVPKNLITADMDEDVELDVLVMCVKRNDDNKVYDYAIVDGNYWGVEYQDYLDCQRMFSNLKEESFKDAILKMYTEIYPEDSGFVNKIRGGFYGNSFKFNLRKLIQIANPTGKLDISGPWH